MTNKEKYIKSIDNLKADEYLKESVMKSIKEKTKKAPYFKLANAAIIMVLVISCAWMMSGQEKIGDNSIYKNQEIAKMDSKIKPVENIEKLKELITPQKQIQSNSANELMVESASTNTTRELTDAIESKYYEKDETTDYSKTNVQVQGVDEADIVKTDGNYIYYSGIDNKIIIVDANNNLNKVSEIIIDEERERNYGGIQEMYLNGNDLVVISQEAQLCKCRNYRI